MKPKPPALKSPPKARRRRTPAAAEIYREPWPRQEAQMQAAIEADPKAALRDAYQRMDYGVALLLKLIASGKLRYSLTRADGTVHPSDTHDEAERVLCNRVTDLIQEVCKLAREGRFDPANTAWHGAKDLVETLHDVALQGPAESLGFIARGSLFLPSLRAKAKTFTHDFAEVAEALELSQDCVVNMSEEALHQLDSAATRLVAELIEDIAYWQREVRRSQEHLEIFQRRAVERPGQGYEKFVGLSPADFWLKDYPRHQAELGYADLPPLDQATWQVWWKRAVKPRLEAPKTLEQLKGTTLYEELRRATDTGKDYELRDELKRRCKPKLKALAKPALPAKAPEV